MRGRDLPASRTDRFSRPVGTSWVEYDDFVLLDTPENRLTSSGHALVLDRPPEDPAFWLKQWVELQGAKGVPQPVVVWEHRTRVELDIPDGSDRRRLWTLMCDRPLDPMDGPATIRRCGPDDLDRLCHFAVHTGEDNASTRWAIQGWLARVQAGAGDFWAATLDDEIVAVVGLYRSPREARTQWIATHPAHRRKGICTQLLTHAVHHHQDENPGIVYTVAVDGSEGERLYRRLGWRRVTCLDKLVWPGPGGVNAS